MTDSKTKSISFRNLGINNASIRYQLTSDELHALTIEKKQGKTTSLGAVAVNTGEFTGRSPKDRFIVKDAVTKDEVWWSDINIPFVQMKTINCPFGLSMNILGVICLHTICFCVQQHPNSKIFLQNGQSSMHLVLWQIQKKMVPVSIILQF